MWSQVGGRVWRCCRKVVWGSTRLWFQVRVGQHEVVCVGKGTSAVFQYWIWKGKHFHKLEKGTKPFLNFVPKSGAPAYTCQKLNSILLIRNLWRSLFHCKSCNVRTEIVSMVRAMMVCCKI